MARLNQNMLFDNSPISCDKREEDLYLGKPSREKSAVFFNIVQKAFDPRKRNYRQKNT